MSQAQFRPATLQERSEFYEKEFSIEKVKSWFALNNLPLPQFCAVDAGSESGVIISTKLKNQLLYFPFQELSKKIKQYLPEDIYYDRNVYRNPKKVLQTLKFREIKKQELAFDVDADNIFCRHPPKERVCCKCLRKAHFWALKLDKELKKIFNKTALVYSGRGFHIHVLDKKAFLLSSKERSKLNKKFSKYPVDPWVSNGHSPLIRLPYSLNSPVSRITMPLSSKEKFIKQKTIPRFLSAF